ncbi:SsrA-binding protein SmpB [uncultured Sphaerochaeta sp.]|uniref:SsrA-binding protein SmpB n=1 Tax=uncultured Sphaerochaeta sp. TaxID=886478 RepID=UPI002A0A1268|nr:SsrA-binding protein SmpB [uncultured Sphaerochaeta sp.]MCK9348702.1 SsrA-binding protein SmpB [Sphaerochaeta sp.]MDC7228892.1 SsrA-binding protein SmpB [Sphaerochaetaceae bacterium]MDD4302226.1 SsrA-binding protein SmpB [Sphaerochaeta sp.]MDY0244853.1 SsrA-binding protein SmpB [Sphaerochaeta sp.]
MKQDRNKFKLLQKNKKAYFNYEVIEDLECGISLAGTEVKSIRDGRFSFSDSYVTIDKQGLTLVGLTIQPYTHGNINNHEPNRNRRLLAHKAEIKKFKRKVDEKGFTLVPTSIYLKGNLVKVQISLCRGKQLHDKRAVVKERDLNRDTRRELKQLQY